MCSRVGHTKEACSHIVGEEALSLKSERNFLFGLWIVVSRILVHAPSLGKTKLSLMALGRKGEKGTRTRAIWSEKVMTNLGNGKLSHQAPLNGWQEPKLTMKTDSWLTWHGR